MNPKRIVSLLEQENGVIIPICDIEFLAIYPTDDYNRAGANIEGSIRVASHDELYARSYRFGDISIKQGGGACGGPPVPGGC